MKVTIQVQGTRKPYSWVSTFPAHLLFANREVIVVKGCGTHSFFETKDGHFKMAGFNRDHPHAKLVPERHLGWRIHPDSLKRVKAKLKAR